MYSILFESPHTKWYVVKSIAALLSSDISSQKTPSLCITYSVGICNNNFIAVFEQFLRVESIIIDAKLSRFLTVKDIQLSGSGS